MPYSISWIGQAQQGVRNPVKWNSDIVKISDTEYDVVLSGIIDEEWLVFSQFTNEDGSLPSVLTFENLNGKGLHMAVSVTYQYRVPLLF